MGIHLRQDGTRSSEGSDAVIRIEKVNALGGVTGLSLGVPNTEFVAHFGTLVVKRIAKYRTRDAWTESETPRESPKSLNRRVLPKRPLWTLSRKPSERPRLIPRPLRERKHQERKPQQALFG